MSKLKEGIDYTMVNGKMVLSSSFLLRRGFCCENGCMNCPYNKKDKNEKR